MAVRGRKAAIIQGLKGLVGQVIAERYRLDELIAVGGMGAVFRSRHLPLEKDVAVKLLRPDLSANHEVCARLQREAKLSSRLDHPNCVRVLDFGTTREGTRFLVMELLRGRDLSGLLDRPMPPARVVNFTRQILQGLDHAHRRGILHRDIKPGNIRLVVDDSGRQLVKVCDFGIAKAVGDGTPNTVITQIGTIFGTPVYMSPEQAAGNDIDHRADLYSVGVVMFEMLSGQPPFRHPDPIALLHAKMAGDIPQLPGVPRPIVEVMHRLMAVDRAERFQSAYEAAAAVEAAGQVAALPPDVPPTDWYQEVDKIAERDLGGGAPAVERRSDTSILRAFGAGLDKVLEGSTPHAQSQLVSNIRGEDSNPSVPAARSKADEYIDMDNLQLEDIGDHNRD